MLPTARKVNCVIAMFLVTLHVSCGGAPRPSVESYRLTQTDVEVLRVAVTSVIQPRIGDPPKPAMVLITSTLTIPIWQAPPASLAPLPPLPPPPFASSRDQVLSPPQSPPSQALDAALLSPAERAAWELRNRWAGEIPDLGIAGLVNRHSADDVPADWTVVAASAAIYPTKETALLYAQFRCGSTCGEGRLIRLRRDGASWRITESQWLWIS